ncbi:MAG: glutaredoxin domain-containing protein [Pseudomonadota bacterium]|jgi:glutaredoxin|nr:glutaredoxin family protein [Pseudomonadota bacterium]MEC8218394.1 glutaredoxin domain-containing protein [Pseudomonadota bacterium]GIR01659.1 MAG: glutaredoxin 3 [Gammaproteobacteria bacterium]
MKFLIFTKYRCSYCDRAKTLIEQKGFEYESINIEEDNNIEILLEKNKYARTMPQIFINDKLIGGYTDLVKYFEE